MTAPALLPWQVGALAAGRFDASALTDDTARALILHRLAIAVADQLPGSTPETTATRLILERRKRAVMTMMQVVAALRRLSAALEAAEVRHLVIKGPALAVQTTGHWQGRPATDIDLLIAPRDAGRAHLALTADGFARRDGRTTAPTASYRWCQCELVYTGPTAVPLDLHWRMDTAAGLCDLPFDTLWGRRYSVEIAGDTVQTLDPVDALLFTAMHGNKSGWNRWGMILDAHRQWDALSAAQRDTALARAELAGCARPLALMLALMVETSDPSCPPRPTPETAGLWRPRARTLLSRTAEATAPSQSIPSAIGRLMDGLRMAPGPLTAAGGLLRGALRPMIQPTAYRAHIMAAVRHRPKAHVTDRGRGL